MRMICVDKDVLEEILREEYPEDYAIGVSYNSYHNIVTVHRIGKDKIEIKGGWFMRPGTSPDFEDLHIIDHGQTIRLGNFEAAVDAILWDFDEEYKLRKRSDKC